MIIAIITIIEMTIWAINCLPDFLDAPLTPAVPISLKPLIVCLARFTACLLAIFIRLSKISF